MAGPSKAKGVTLERAEEMRASAPASDAAFDASLGEKVARTKAALASEATETVFIRNGGVDEDNDQRAVHVQINSVKFSIAREVPVELPASIVAILRAGRYIP